MAFTLEIQASRTLQLPLTSSCIDEIEGLRAGGESAGNVATVFGTPDVQSGSRRVVDRRSLVDGIDRLIFAARSLPGRFHVVVPPLVIDGVQTPLDGGRGAAVSIEGVPHLVSCAVSY